MDDLSSKVLLLTHSHDTSAERLKNLLQTSAELSVDVCQIHEFDASVIRQQLSGSKDPGVIIIVVGANADWPPARFIRDLKSSANAAVMMAIHNCPPTAIIELLEAGVADFVTAPWKEIDLLPRVWQMIRQPSVSLTLSDSFRERIGLSQLIGNSEVFVNEVRKIPTIAKCNANVLITGETGTGKELFARAVHYLSPRAHAPFVAINCGGTPIELLENELFGHERGAFTGADRSERGLVQEADGGTLFLDEIDCLPLPGQVKLLRFLQDKEFRPLGSKKTHRVNARVVSATNSVLDSTVRSGRFRADLYFRLNVIPLHIPPLRQRRDDIPLLVKNFLNKYAVEFQKQITDVSPQVRQTLVLHDWPGNVRELEHVIERAVALSEKKIIDVIDLDNAARVVDAEDSFREAKAKVVNNFEVTYIENLLLKHNGNITQAAQVARKNRRAFWELIRKHGIDADRFKLAATPS